MSELGRRARDGDRRDREEKGSRRLEGKRPGLGKIPFGPRVVTQRSCRNHEDVEYDVLPSAAGEFC